MTLTNENGAPSTAIENARNGSGKWVYAEPDPILPPTRAARAEFFKANDVRPERGEFVGDGIPRTFGGHPYESLDWGHVLIFGRGGAR